MTRWEKAPRWWRLNFYFLVSFVPGFLALSVFLFVWAAHETERDARLIINGLGVCMIVVAVSHGWDLWRYRKKLTSQQVQQHDRS